MRAGTLSPVPETEAGTVQPMNAHSLSIGLACPMLTPSPSQGSPGLLWDQVWACCVGLLGMCPLPLHRMVLLPLGVWSHPSLWALWTSGAGGKVRSPIFLPSFPPPLAPLAIPPAPGLAPLATWKLV